MIAEVTPSMSELNAGSAQTGWRNLYTLAGLAACWIVLAALLDTVLTFLPGGATPDPGKGSVMDWFGLLQKNWFLGLRGLGILNVLTASCGVPVFLALYALHRRRQQAAAALVTAFLLLGVGLYIAGNPALSMLRLSSQYAGTTAAAEKSALLTAGQALLARGEDFTPGSFLSWAFFDLALVGMSGVMLRGGQFSKITAWLGILGFSLMLVYIFWSTFIPLYYNLALLVSMFGGLAAMAWELLIAHRLFQLGRGASDAGQP